jgi:hypothetical protein
VECRPQSPPDTPAAAAAAAACLQFIPPGEIVEGLTAEPEDNPFARLFNKRPSTSDIMSQRIEVDLADARSYNRQIYDQVRDHHG